MNKRPLTKSTMEMDVNYKKIDEMMTKRNLQKFKDIKRRDTKERNKADDDNSIVNTSQDNKDDFEKQLNLLDDLTDKVVGYNLDKSDGVFSPDDAWRIVWDLFGMVFILYQALLVPFRLCFEISATGGLAVFELIQDFYFMIDIFITANTGYYEKGNLILKRTNIIINYLMLWFWLDIAASFPYSLVIDTEDYFNLYPESNTSNKTMAPQIIRILKLIKFMRILRLLRVLKLKKIMVKVSLYKFNSIYFYILFFSLKNFSCQILSQYSLNSSNSYS